MGIFDALTTSVAGLQAQSFALQNISGNIANSQTTGYKETDTSFEDMVSAASVAQTYANGVIANSVATNSVQGTIQSTQVSTDMAINGNGYFVVAQPTGSEDNQPVFSGVSDYTRAGDFQLNSGGYLVNGAGYYLMGIPIDAATGNPVGIRIRFSVQQRLYARASNHGDPVPGQSAKHAKFGNDRWDRFRSESACRRSGRGSGNGTGATLQPDAIAKLTGNVSLTGATTLSSLGITTGDQITINDGTNTPTTYTVPGGATVTDLITAINNAHTGGTSGRSAALKGGGDLVLSGANGTASVTVTATGSDATDLGFPAGANAAEPTNLLTQGAVSQGDTMTITVGNSRRRSSPSVPGSVRLRRSPSCRRLSQVLAASREQ